MASFGTLFTAAYTWFRVETEVYYLLEIFRSSGTMMRPVGLLRGNFLVLVALNIIVYTMSRFFLENVHRAFDRNYSISCGIGRCGESLISIEAISYENPRPS